MPGLDPGIHDFLVLAETWMAGTSPAMMEEEAATPPASVWWDCVTPKRLSLTTVPDPQSLM
jgi:hypothetical protein